MLDETIEIHLQGFLKQQGLRLAPTTCHGEIGRVRHLMRHLLLDKKDFVTINKQDVESYLYSHKWKQHTRYHSWKSVKLFYDYLIKNGVLTINPALGIEVHDHKELRPIHVPIVTRIRRILHRMERKKGELNVRNRLMAELAYGSGLRRNKIATLNIGDVNINDSTAFILGKGRKERIVPLTRRCVQAFTEYIASIKTPRTFLLAGQGGRQGNRIKIRHFISYCQR